MEAAAATRRCSRRRRPAGIPAGAARPSDLLVAFLGIGVAWLLAAAAVGVAAVATDSYELRWLALHLAFVGGISQLVLGAAQFFACAFLATDPPSRRTIRAQLAVWNAGTVAAAAGVRLDVTPVTGTGGALLLAGLALFALSLRGMRRRTLQRAPWATRWYLSAALFLAVGATLGPLMDGGVRWSHGSLLGAHLVLNLAGWFGTAIVGTLHTFYPSLTATRLRHPRLERSTFTTWVGGIVLLAAAAAFDAQAPALGGWAALLAGAAMLMANLASSARGAERHPPAALLILGAQLLMAAALVVATVVTARSGANAALLGPDRVEVAMLAVAGWIGLTVAGSLLHLLALMGRVRGFGAAVASPERGRAPSSERPYEGAPLAGGAAVVAGLVAASVVRALDGDATAALAVVAGGYLVLCVSIVRLALRAARAAPLRL